MLYDTFFGRTIFRPRPVVGRRRSFRGPDCQLSSSIPSPLEAGPGAAHALQPEVAVGAERLHGADDHRLWHTDARAARRTTPWRSGGYGAGRLYRNLLDGAHSRGCALFLPRRLAEGETVRRWTFLADLLVCGTGKQLLGTARLAGVPKNQKLRSWCGHRIGLRTSHPEAWCGTNQNVQTPHPEYRKNLRQPARIWKDRNWSAHSPRDKFSPGNRPGCYQPHRRSILRCC